MTTQPNTTATLHFEGKPVRTVTFEPGGVPYFYLSDLLEATGWPARDATVTGIYFPKHGKRIVAEDTPDGFKDCTVLSPTGVLAWTHEYDAGKGQRIAAWAKRESRKLCPNASPDDPAMFLKISESGIMPLKPMMWSGWRQEWNELRYSPAFTYRRENTPHARAMRATEQARMDMLQAQQAQQGGAN